VQTGTGVERPGAYSQGMSEKNIAVFGIYSTRIDVERATDALNTAGFPAADISVLMPSSLNGTTDMGIEGNTKAPEGTVAGVTTGGAVGGALGVLAGLGLLAVPGVGPLLAMGPIVGGLAGLGVGGAVGGIAGALIGMGLPEYEAKRYAEHVQDGAILLSVHCDTPGEVLRAKEVVMSSGAEHVKSSGESMVETMSMPAGQAYK